MRLWSIHPQYLDRQGLLAVWREGLLAQKVLAGETKGYKHHPQLVRFRTVREPLDAIGAYLGIIFIEARSRGYTFDRSRIRRPDADLSLVVTTGQLDFERRHLLSKLNVRSPELCRTLDAEKETLPHPMFQVVIGPVESWEKAST